MRLPIPDITIPNSTEKQHCLFLFPTSQKSIGILIGASFIGTVFDKLGFTEVNIITVYILGVLITSVVTRHQIYSLIASVVSVFVFNFCLQRQDTAFWPMTRAYPITFIVMFLAAFITGSLAVQLKNNARHSAQAAFRTKILLTPTSLCSRLPTDRKSPGSLPISSSSFWARILSFTRSMTEN